MLIKICLPFFLDILVNSYILVLGLYPLYSVILGCGNEFSKHIMLEKQQLCFNDALQNVDRFQDIHNRLYESLGPTLKGPAPFS